MSTAMTEMTTKSSMSVKPESRSIGRRERGIIIEVQAFLTCDTIGGHVSEA